MIPDNIATLDLQMVKTTMVNRQGWKPEFFDIVEKKYKGFLALCQSDGDWCPPSVQVDEVWHNHILFTRDYIQMCKNVFGYYLHHAPLTKSDVPKQEVTRKAMSERFGFNFDDKEAPCCTLTNCCRNGAKAVIGENDLPSDAGESNG